MNRFRLINYDENGPQIGPTGVLRLVCNAEDGCKVAISQ